MRATISTELLLKVLQATPEQEAAIERVLGVGEGAAGMTEAAERAEGRMDVAGLLSGIYREIASVRSEVVELRSAKERLERMMAEGLFAFTQKVDATSFKVLCAVLAEGDVAKASRSLGMADSTLRDCLSGWRKRGQPYVMMLDLVRWRKRVGRRQTVALNESVLVESASSTDYPALLSDVLDGLLELTEENWRERSEELAEMLRAAGSRGI